MKYQLPTRKLLLAIVAVFILTASLIDTAFAHVIVKPGESTTATYQVFTINVPNEKKVATTSIKLIIPKEVSSVTPTQKNGWKISIEKKGVGDTATTRSITWNEGTINEGLRDEFTFSAKTPDSPTTLVWKAYQTYSDGTVVSWDQAEAKNEHKKNNNSGPFSVTQITKEAPTASFTARESIAQSQASAERAFYMSISGLIVAFIALFFATRKK